MKHSLIAATAAALSCSAASAAIVQDFSLDDFGSPLANGQDVEAAGSFFTHFTLSSSGALAAAIFDTDPAGPNLGGPDPDLLVGLGNALILQSPSSPAQTGPGIFDTPNDDASGGIITFDFVSAVEMLSIDLIDINGNNQDVLITLTDASNLTRVYDVPSRWTKDIDIAGPNGFDTLDLTSLAPQLGEGGETATASETFGFDPLSVVQVRFELEGSAAIDNLTFIPAPASAMALLLGGGQALRRRRG